MPHGKEVGRMVAFHWEKEKLVKKDKLIGV